MCDDEGVGWAARLLGCRHVPNIERNSYGTPLITNAFAVAQKISTTDVICFVNADIVLMQDFVTSLSIASCKFDRFLMVGRRWDLPHGTSIKFFPGWQQSLRKVVHSRGNRHAVGSSDYFGLRKGLYREMPPLAVGRHGCDNYLISRAVNIGANVVDATLDVMAVHQDAAISARRYSNKEDDSNRDIYMSNRRGVVGTMADAHWKLEEGDIRGVRPYHG